MKTCTKCEQQKQGNNHSKDGWHVDHIIPFDSAKIEQEVYSLCHYSNLQSLWAKEKL